MKFKSYIQKLGVYSALVAGIVSCSDVPFRGQETGLDAMLNDVTGEVKEDVGTKRAEVGGYDISKKDSGTKDYKSPYTAPSSLPTIVVPSTNLDEAIKISKSVVDGCDGYNNWQEGKTYVLDKDIVVTEENGIAFGMEYAKDVVLDCQRHTIKSAIKGKGIGIHLFPTSNVTITNCSIEDFKYGVLALASVGTTVAYNYFQGNETAVKSDSYTHLTERNHFLGNEVRVGKFGFLVEGGGYVYNGDYPFTTDTIKGQSAFARDTIIQGNTFLGLHDDAVNVYAPYLSYIFDNTIENAGIGIRLMFPLQVLVQGNHLKNTDIGMKTYGTSPSYTSIRANEVIGGLKGILTTFPSNLEIVDNTVCSSGVDFTCETLPGVAMTMTQGSVGNKFTTVQGCGTTEDKWILWPIKSVHYTACGKK